MTSPSYPAALDALANPGPTTETDDTGFELDVVIARLQNCVMAIENKLGTGASTPGATAAVLRRTASGASSWGPAQSGDFALTTAEADFATTVALNVAGSYFDGPSVSLAAGTWLVVGAVEVGSPTATSQIVAKLWDGTTVKASAEILTSAANSYTMMTLAGIVSPVAPATWKISARAPVDTAAVMRGSPFTATGSTSCFIRAVRIA